MVDLSENCTDSLCPMSKFLKILKFLKQHFGDSIGSACTYIYLDVKRERGRIFSSWMHNRSGGTRSGEGIHFVWDLLALVSACYKCNKVLSQTLRSLLQKGLWNKLF